MRQAQPADLAHLAGLEEEPAFDGISPELEQILDELVCELTSDASSDRANPLAQRGARDRSRLPGGLRRQTRSGTPMEKKK